LADDRDTPAPCLGACSWSLRPRSAAALARSLRSLGLTSVQLALGPLDDPSWRPDRTLGALRAAGIAVRSAMMSMRGEDYSSLESIRATGGVRPDAHWPANRAAAERQAAFAWRLGVRLVSFHAGFLPHRRDDPVRATMLERLRTIVDVYAAHAVQVAFETGQESADTLLDVLAELDRPAAGINFDPANMLLYDVGDPVAALDRLAPHVRQIHVKDARRTRVPGTWGEEVPVGQGEVDWGGFFEVFARHRLRCDLMIEREAGDDRAGDICRARDFVLERLAALGGVAG
jgi:sugar phosphate isomerase/epimerase